MRLLLGTVLVKVLERFLFVLLFLFVLVEWRLFLVGGCGHIAALERRVFGVVLLLEEVEVVLKRAVLVEQQFEVLHADDDRIDGTRQLQFLVGLEDGAVVLGLAKVGKAPHHEQSHVPETHLLQVVVAHHKGGEIMPCHGIEQQVAAHRVGGIEQHKHLRLVLVFLERCELGLEAVGRDAVAAQARAPQHAARIAAAALDFATSVQVLHDATGHRRDVGLRIALQHVLDGALELVVVFAGDITQGVDEHELGHDGRQRIALGHLAIDGMHRGVVIVQVSIIGLLVERLLHGEHRLEVVDVVRVLQCGTLLAVGKVREDELAIRFALFVITQPLIHEVHVVVGVETVLVVGIATQQFLKLVGRGIKVLEFVLEDDTHVVESGLDDVVGGLDLLLGGGNLLEVVFLVVRVLTALEGFLVHFHAIGAHRVGGGHERGVLFGIIVVVERERGLVAATPVILEFAVAPLLLESRLTGILRGGVVEVPRIVGVHLELVGRVGVVLQL